jgi:hypothetical protein
MSDIHGNRLKAALSVLLGVANGLNVPIDDQLLVSRYAATQKALLMKYCKSLRWRL